MPRSSYNHVSIYAKDVAESAQFYVDLFGAEIIGMPNMGVGPAPHWLKIGDQQLHLIGAIKPGGEPIVQTVPTHTHIALSVDDLAEVYRLARERNIPEDDCLWGYPLNVLPNGQVQYYVRDPTGNLVEVDFDDYKRLPEEVLERAHFQEDRFKQTEEQKKAKLFLK